MMKYFTRILSYILAIVIGFMLAFILLYSNHTGFSKLDALQRIISEYFIAEYDSEAITDAAADAMISALGDRWSYYLSAEEYQQYEEESENAYTGIGVTITRDEDYAGFRILRVNAGSGAEAAGLCADDVILSADGKSTDNMTTAELRSIVRGTAGTDVTLGISRNGESMTVSVTRTVVETPVATGQLLDGNIGLITIENFENRCASETIAAIESLLEQGADSFIFDVRNNPGGRASELVELLDFILPEGVLFRSVDYAGNESVDTSDAEFLDYPIVVLCNENSYSAAEFFAAAIQEYQAGTIIGTPTCGKGYFQYVFKLSDGSAVGLSAGKYYTPNGVSLAGIGIQPDILCETDEETSANIYYDVLAPDADPQIAAAVEILHGAGQ